MDAPATAAAKAPIRSATANVPAGTCSPSSSTPAAIGTMFVAAVIGASEAMAPPCWNERWSSAKPAPCAPAVA